MPPRKEPREQVYYPPSKSKGPAFKPLKPSKFPRIPSTASESSVKSKATAKKPTTAKRKRSTTVPEEDDDGAEKIDSDDDLPDPRSLGFTSASKITKPAPAKRKTTAREPSPESIASQHENEPPDDTAAGAEAPPPTQFDDIPSIPQALLLRLLHDSFQDKNTRIDKHAIQVFQKYIEIFVREAIARCTLDKKEAAEKGEVAEVDAGWLELEDLEKAAPGLMLDF
ncbi:hypothetical protein AC579_5730 [Pseudocercospora musae]|uniref:Uncharacterized protein n=1 Tax=Pseudocercospora musae TaxID=113226 RepID=A0A139IRT0_9PEZI|nr:hypothetical protein AC579_5730 [Pseudocercospora musae]